jgi:hypothetical protein
MKLFFFCALMIVLFIKLKIDLIFLITITFIRDNYFLMFNENKVVLFFKKNFQISFQKNIYFFQQILQV